MGARSTSPTSRPTWRRSTASGTASRRAGSDRAGAPNPRAGPREGSIDPKETQRIRDFLASRRVLCPRCEYLLTGSRGDRCPECGLRLTMAGLRRAHALPVPAHLKVAMTIESVLGVVLIMPCIHPHWDRFAGVACFGIGAVLLPGIWYGMWRVGSAESGETDPWKLDTLGVLVWIAVLATAVAAGVLLVP